MRAATSLPIDTINAALQQAQFDMTRNYFAQTQADVDGLTLLGLCLREQERWAEVIGPFSQLTRMQPHSAILGQPRHRAAQHQADARGLLMNMGYLYLERGIYPQARDCFLDAHALEPDSPEARICAVQMGAC